MIDNVLSIWYLVTYIFRLSAEFQIRERKGVNKRMDCTIKGTFRQLQTQLPFKTEEGNDMVWSKLTLTNEIGDQFISSMDNDIANKIIEEPKEKWVGKEVTVTGLLRRFGGVLKFKATGIELSK